MDCGGDPNACGRVVSGSDESWDCVTDDMCGTDGTVGTLTGTIQCMGYGASLAATLSFILLTLALSLFA